MTNTLEKTICEKMKSFLLDSFFNCICQDKLINSQTLNDVHKRAIALKRFVRLKANLDSPITCMGIRAGFVLDAPLE